MLLSAQGVGNRGHALVGNTECVQNTNQKARSLTRLEQV